MPAKGQPVKSLIVAGTKLLRSHDVGRWKTEDGRFVFDRVNVETICESPHPTTEGFCFGDEHHHIRVWQATDTTTNKLAFNHHRKGFNSLTAALEYVVYELKNTRQ